MAAAGGGRPGKPAVASLPEGKVKILLVGPSEVGKTLVANFLCDVTDSLEVDPSKKSPTAGCRIVETERDVPGVGHVSVELWDVSGDQSFEACWPAIQKDATGVILMYDPSSAGHEKEIELWCDWFVVKAGLSRRQAVVFAHSKTEHAGTPEPPPALRGLEIFPTSFESPAALREGFGVLIANCARALSR